MKLKKTYWNGNGKHQKLASFLLRKAIPYEGKVSGLQKVDRFRVLTNLYWDLNKNGGINMAKDIADECRLELTPETALECEHLDEDAIKDAEKILERKLNYILPQAYEEFVSSQN